MITVRPVSGRRDWRTFRQVPRLVYRDDPHWVAGDIADIDTVLINPTPEMNARIATRAFLAYDGTVPVGRVVAIADLVFIGHTGEQTAFFGFYEAVDDSAVSSALLDAVASWARGRSLTTLVGPMSPNMLYSAGFLIGGVDAPPLVGMPHNPRYYADQVEAWGLRKVKDFHTFYVDEPNTLVQTPAFERKTALARRWRERSKATFRSMDPRTFEQDIEIVRELYNAAFGQFWGFTPVEPDEMLDLANSMKPILDPELVLIAEIEGRPVAFLMGIPDVNKAAVTARRWRSGLVRDLHTIVRWKGPGGRKLRTHVRIDMMAVHPDCPDMGVSSLLIYELFERIEKGGYSSAEAAPVLEDGGWVSAFRKSYPVEPNRRYRVYSADLAVR
ncbi:hypothetical protein GCM10007304_17260 [Rhodococcoides trifolii]|uniref:N-acetyltransferase domain-containing protein n=1 Tax=Rhodococcoides trifolii TaxID=908250 RepID=A0A917CZ86_9NOCA|nr:hypothetical protein [Rhodococcus trifolii]GGG03702.1 hypothetical protein GCM10007304_17260 [Rhodococcus trifolii]